MMIVGYSADADDAFMVYALEKNKIKSPYRMKFVRSDIENLNDMALNGKMDVGSVSFGAYPYMEKKYSILSCGSSFGYGYGPVVVSKKPMRSLKGKVVASPGRFTTANLLLNVFSEDFSTVHMRFDKIVDAVKSGKVDAGIILHEGQITYKRQGLRCVMDFGKVWKSETNLPLPLGAMVVKRRLNTSKISDIMKSSIKYAMDNPKSAVSFAKRFSRNVSQKDLEKFVSMYVNRATLDIGSDEKKAVRKLYSLGRNKGVIPTSRVTIV